VVALGTVAFAALATAASGAGPRSWAPPPCVSPADPGSVAAEPRPAGLAELDREAWFRMDPVIDSAGALQGQRVVLGLDGARSIRTQFLPAESFVAGPFGGVVLVGSDDGASSTLDAIDVAQGCVWALAGEADVVRRATIDPTGATVYEARVDRSTRADLGVWARALDGTPAHRVLDPIDLDERFGPTFTTEFAWDPSGRTLAVQSCGEAACRTRFIDGDGATSFDTIADPDLGTMIGLDDGRLVTNEACPGYPCPIVAIDLATHARVTLAEAAGIGVLVSTPDGTRLVHESFMPAGLTLRSVAIDGSSPAELGAIADGVRLHATPDRAGAATRLPSGWALLAADGRIAVDGPADHGQLRHVPDGASVQLDEVIR
jgi:hypothetical protein